MSMKRCSFGAALLLVGMTCQNTLAVVTGVYLLEGTAADTSGLGRDGTLVGAPTFTGLNLYQGSTSALILNGTTQSVQLPTPNDYIRNAPGATLMAWVRPNAVTGTTTFLGVNNGDAAAGTGNGGSRAVLAITGGQFRALGRQGDAGAASFTAAGFTPAVGTNYFVAGVFDYLGGSIRLYVNGAEVASNLTTLWAANSTDTANLAARIGAQQGTTLTEFFNGRVDGARIFNTALSATDILNTYTSELLVPGDTDGDGVAEPSDLTPIRTNYRATVTARTLGDLTGNGFVDFADFRQWKTAILSGGGSLAGLDLSFAAVPEPSTVWLGVCGLFGIASAVRRPRR